MKFKSLCFIIYLFVVTYSVQSLVIPEKIKPDAVNFTGLREFDGVPIEASSDVVDAVIVKAVEIPEEKVTYEGSQLWRVLADNEQADFVSFLQDTGGMILFSLQNNLKILIIIIIYDNRSCKVDWK